MRRAGLIFLAALAACATTNNLDASIGQPIQEAYVRWGPPSTQFDMPDGAVAYQWRKSSTSRLPVSVQSTLKERPYSDPRVSTQIAGGGSVTSECILTLITRKDTQEVARIESYRQTGDCG